MTITLNYAFARRASGSCCFMGVENNDRICGQITQALPVRREGDQQNSRQPDH